ncbi:hypothetical protein FHL15_007529 [Xylaria flabelliformis]|uniref:Uncharacterized protein n=1 Tax=Xylaria flabelliformis TaxID=2512241 RepID=A0A553HUB1_9PEZI|nr:hypothetical protein FHL15_007529 [Xylaria flabelliformis]
MWHPLRWWSTAADSSPPKSASFARKGLNCQYIESSSRSRQTSRPRPLPIKRRQRNSDALTFSDVLLSGSIPLGPAASGASIHAEVSRLIRFTGRCLDDVSANYFQSIYRYLPFISRVRFQSDLVTGALTDLSAIDVRGFSRAAQAAWLVDQVLTSYDIANFDARLSRLVALDESIQAFLSSSMQQCQGEGGVFCEANVVTPIHHMLNGDRLHHNLHWHILDTEAEGENADLLTERMKHSRVALRGKQSTFRTTSEFLSTLGLRRKLIALVYDSNGDRSLLELALLLGYFNDRH